MAKESSKIKFPFEHCGLATQSKGADNLLLFNEKFSSKFQLLKTFPLNRASAHQLPSAFSCCVESLSICVPLPV